MSGIPIVFRCGTLEEWESNDPVLFAGELGLVLSGDPDTQLMKIGNGTNTWTELPWASRGPRGFDFAYNWDGTSLGVKYSDEASFTYVDLGMYFQWTGTQLGIKRGEDAVYTEQELALDFNWSDTQLGVKNPATETYTYTGLGLQFQWDGYSLGVKREEDAEFVYTNLQGDTPGHQWTGTQLQFENPDGSWGANQELSPDFNWDGTQLGIKNPAATNYVYQNLAMQYTWAGTELGVKNPDEAEYAYANLKGEKGDKPDHQWDATKLQFENTDGTWGGEVDLKGETGDPGLLSQGKIWVGNSDDVAAEQALPDTSVKKIEGIKEFLRKYVVLYSQTLQPEAWTPWSKIRGKPETYPPSSHGHPVSDLGVIDYYVNVTNKPLLAPLKHNHDDRTKRLSTRRSYMYGG